jgi:hypothetical protein
MSIRADASNELTLRGFSTIARRRGLGSARVFASGAAAEGRVTAAASASCFEFTRGWAGGAAAASVNELG